MAEGNNGSPYRRSHHRGGGGGHFSPMHTTTGASNEETSDNPVFSGDQQGLWDNFESVACAVTDLYRNASWNAFQRTAAATTQFYKDSVDAYRRGTDAGMTIGRQILCKELLHWLQTSTQASPYVRRDELINFILTRAVLPASNSNVETNAASSPTSTNHSTDHGNSSPMQTQHQDGQSINHNYEPLEIFQEALAVQPSRQQSTAAASATNVGLTAFFVEECRRHTNGKRRRLSPEHHPYYFHSSDSSPDSNNGNWHSRPSKRSRRL